MKTCLNCGYASETDFRFCPTCGAKDAGGVGPSDSLVGRTLNDKYRVLAKIGAGSMGTVYLGEHTGLKKRVALKVLHPDLLVNEETLSRFHREGIAAGRFNHPNAIQIFDFDRADPRISYLAMEYVEGTDLKARIRDSGPVELEEALHLVSQVLSVLAEAHRQGIVHRDLKPENIMVVTNAAGESSVKVLDFGLSKLLAHPLEASLATQVGRIMGTPLYMSPEQCRGEEVDHRADLYAVGLILYEMLSGETPFRAETVTEIFSKHLTERAPSLRDTGLSLPAGLESFVERALEKDREERYQSAEEMIAELRRVREGHALPARARRARSSRSRAAREGERASALRGTRGVLLAALVIVLALGAVWLTSQGPEPSETFARVSLKDPARRSEQEDQYLGMLDRARASLREGSAQRALVTLDEARRVPVADSEVFLLRAEAYRATGDDDMARADLQEALRLDPSYAAAAAAMGWLSYDQGDVDGALERFDEAQRLDPTSAEGLAGRGAVLHARGEHEKARELLLRAVAAEPSHALAHVWLGRACLALEELEAARDAFVQAKREDPRSALACAGLGEVYVALGRPEEARAQLEDAVRLDAEDPAPRALLAALLIDEGRGTEALEALDAGLSSAPEDPSLRSLRGAALVLAERPEEARSELEHALRLGADDPRARLLLGVLHQRDGRHERALEHFDAVLERDPDHALAHLDRGLSLFALERFDEARAPLERAVELAPDHAYASYALGVLLMDHLGDPEGAARHLARYRELGGEDERVAAWIEDLR